MLSEGNHIHFTFKPIRWRAQGHVVGLKHRLANIVKNIERAYYGHQPTWLCQIRHQIINRVVKTSLLRLLKLETSTNPWSKRVVCDITSQWRLDGLTSTDCLHSADHRCREKKGSPGKWSGLLIFLVLPQLQSWPASNFLSCYTL